MIDRDDDCGDWLHEVKRDKWLDERDQLQARVAELERYMRRCLLSGPPGDCYAAEAVDLRARVAELETLLQEVLDNDVLRATMERKIQAALGEHV